MNLLQNYILYITNNRQKYCKILRRRNLSNKNTGIYFAALSRGESFKPTLQAEILQKFSGGGIHQTKRECRDISRLSRGGSFKQKLQAEILQNSQVVEFINQNYRQKYYKVTKRHWCFLTQHILININQLRMSQVKNVKISTSTGGQKK